jgi:hypothetical protein
MTLNLDLDPDIEAKLRQRAAAAGKDPETYALEAVLEKLTGPHTLADILAPVHEEFRRSGMSQEELKALCEQALAQSRSRPNEA